MSAHKSGATLEQNAKVPLDVILLYVFEGDITVHGKFTASDARRQA